LHSSLLGEPFLFEHDTDAAQLCGQRGGQDVNECQIRLELLGELNRVWQRLA